MTAGGDPEPASRGGQQTEVLVVFFDDMKGSTVLKEQMAAASDEQAFQMLRREHDALLTEVITRDAAGEVIKSTGDGLLAVFRKPSVAVERAIEIQERLHNHPYIKVRMGLDMGEVSVEADALGKQDTFGRHVDWAARCMELGEAGHILVTRAVYTDAFSWIRKARIAWQEHGHWRKKPHDPPLEIFEPYNANLGMCMDQLNGERVVQEEAPPPVPAPAGAGLFEEEHVRLARSWEAVARDGRDFAQNGAGIMYWFKVPLGGVCYPEGFRNFLQPALENPRITKIRFMLDSTTERIPRIWADLVIPLLRQWAEKAERAFTLREEDGAGQFAEPAGTNLSWVFGDLSQEFTPTFKLLVPDPDTDDDTPQRAQVFLATADRRVRFMDGSLHSVRIPDAVLRVEPRGNEGLLSALNAVANQWDPLFL